MVIQGYLGKNINVKTRGQLKDSSDLPGSKAIGRIIQNLVAALQIKTEIPWAQPAMLGIHPGGLPGFHIPYIIK